METKKLDTNNWQLIIKCDNCYYNMSCMNKRSNCKDFKQKYQ